MSLHRRLLGYAQRRIVDGGALASIPPRPSLVSYRARPLVLATVLVVAILRLPVPFRQADIHIDGRQGLSGFHAPLVRGAIEWGVNRDGTLSSPISPASFPTRIARCSSSFDNGHCCLLAPPLPFGRGPMSRALAVCLPDARATCLMRYACFHDARRSWFTLSRRLRLRVGHSPTSSSSNSWASPTLCG